MKCSLAVKTATNSDQRFCAISPFISAASPEKMDRDTKLRTTSGTMKSISTSRVAHIVITNIGEIHYHKKNTTNGE